MEWTIANHYISDYPKQSGNYAIYVSDNDYMGENRACLMYVGTAKNLYNRLKNHDVLRTLFAIAEEEICWFDRLIVKYYVEPNEDKRRREEMFLIQSLQPLINKQGKVPDYNDYSVEVNFVETPDFINRWKKLERITNDAMDESIK